jgi:quercetin dioxygenase-like cupin family protein
MSSLQYTYDPKYGLRIPHVPPKQNPSAKTSPFRSQLPDLSPVFQYELVNCPGKTLVGLLVKYGPGAATPPHRHGSASVTGYVLSGSLYNKMNDQALEVKHTGSSWYEAPGCHHRVSANFSNSEPATLLAIFVVDTDVIARGGLAALTVFDEEYRHLEPKLSAGH